MRLAALFLLLAVPASGQVVLEIGTSRQTYTPTCNVPFVAESATIVNPTQARYADPARPTMDCALDIANQVTLLPAGTYRARLSLDGLAWGPLSSAFTRAVVVPTGCLDGQTAYPGGAGPVVERLANDTVAKRAIWAARVKALRAAGFQVDVLLNSTSVYLHATCHG